MTTSERDHDNHEIVPAFQDDKPVPTIELIDTDIEVELDDTPGFSLADLGPIGAAIAALPAPARSIIQIVNMQAKDVFHIVDENGNFVDPSKLFHFKKGPGLVASYKDKKGLLHQCRLIKANAPISQAIAMPPFNPMTLVMATMIFEISNKLDDLLAVQREMYDYLKDRDRAALRADLQSLYNMMEDARFHWDSERFKSSRLNDVQRIKAGAEKTIIAQRAQIERKNGKLKALHASPDVKRTTGSLIESFKEYRLAIYIYAFSSFLETLLLENFDREYLATVYRRIEGHANDYRLFYTKAYNSLEKKAHDALDAKALDVASGAARFLGNALENSPLGALPFDEALHGASKAAKHMRRQITNDTLDGLKDVSASDVRPFLTRVARLDTLYNQPVMLVSNENSVHLLPISNTEA